MSTNEAPEEAETWILNPEQGVDQDESSDDGDLSKAAELNVLGIYI